MTRPRLRMPWWCAGAMALAVISTAGSVAPLVLAVFRTPDEVPVAVAVRRSKAAVGDASIASSRWREPVVRGGRHGELFTVPTLVFDDDTGRFVPRPLNEMRPPALETVLELLEVNLQECPLRLVGHVGSGASLQGIFARAESGGTVVAGAGHVFSENGIVVESVRLRRPPKGGRREAIAVVRDTLSGEQVELQSGQPAAFGPALARVRVVATERIHELSEGTLIEIAGWAYRVTRVHQGPDSVELVPERAGAPAVAWRDGGSGKTK